MCAFGKFPWVIINIQPRPGNHIQLGRRRGKIAHSKYFFSRKRRGYFMGMRLLHGFFGMSLLISVGYVVWIRRRLLWCHKVRHSRVQTQTERERKTGPVGHIRICTHITREKKKKHFKKIISNSTIVWRLLREMSNFYLHVLILIIDKCCRKNVCESDLYSRRCRLNKLKGPLPLLPLLFLPPIKLSSSLTLPSK